VGAKEQSGRTWSSFHLTRGTLVDKQEDNGEQPEGHTVQVQEGMQDMHRGKQKTSFTNDYKENKEGEQEGKQNEGGVRSRNVNKRISRK
jgi:hypothetical protein